MPPVPPACQSIANDVAALEASDAQLRATLSTLTGAAAWAVLAQIGDVRRQLEGKRAELGACVAAASAVVQANLVVIDLGAVPATPPSRTAQLWDLGGPIPAQHSSAAVANDTFALAGPLPASYGVTVTTTGDADVVGPDFRSDALSPAQSPSRVEVVLGPLVQIRVAELQGWLMQLLPHSTLLAGGGGITADVTVSSGTVSCSPGHVTVAVMGQATPRTTFPGMAIYTVPFGASITLGLVPTSAPAVADPVDTVTLTDASIEAPGFVGALATALLGPMRSFVTEFVTGQLRAALRTAIPKATERAFALPALPSGTNLSIRRLAVEAEGLTFQPAIGAVGTTLSQFSPPTIPPL